MFQKSIEKIQVQLAFEQTEVHLLHSAQFVFEWEMLLTNVVSNIRAHILESIIFNNRGKIV